MSGSAFIEGADKVERAAAELHERTRALVAVVVATREQRRADAPIAQMVADAVALGAVTARRAVEDAWRAYAASVSELRAATVRMLVDETGMTFTDVARVLGISRQMASRLYASS
ncbi:MAG TPA: hypothetical protein VGP92_04740 [Acidimicrobiia bacterium]|jgi:CRP-like cAMP-binding protein|nr:hypothetical protein [Acidimicrobiia bacterium]